MQNKGFVRVFAILLTLVCVFYLSFSFVTRHYTSKAKEFAKGDVKVEQDYLDSLANEKVYFGNWTLKQCREMEISLGLDLKGGMNVILEVSVPDVIKVLADNKTDEAFNQALATAAKQATTSQDDVITLFVREYHKLAPGAPLSQLFATQQLKDKVTQKSTDAEVEKVLREEVKAAVDNSYNVLRTRIDRFGVVQPNIQSLEDKMGRIMVELPGIKEPERVRKLLQGSANLEFWETYTAKDVTPYLQAADTKLRAIVASETPAEEADSAATEAPAVAQATSTADSLAAALKGENKTQTADLAQIKKEHPLFAILQVNPSGQGPVVAYANYKDTAEINRYLSMPEVQAEMPKDLRLKWGVSPYEYDPKAQTFELYAIRSTERNGKAPLEGDVVVSAKDEYDHYGKPAVSMSMNTDGARRWAQLTKQNIGKSIAIVLDGYVFNFGTGPIRGFATTLIIGILISFFTAVFMTRLFYDYFMGKDKLLNLTFSSKISKNLMANVHFDFMGRNKLWLTITGAAVVVCIAFLATRGLSQSIDFTGGRNFKVQFENKVEPEQIRELISSKFGDANVSVIAIGTDGKTVRISTNYRIEEEGNNIDSEIEAYLYETLKPVLTQNITLETFIDRENHTGGSIISSQKVGPSIADDIKVSAIWSVVLALIAIGVYILIRFRNIAYSIGSVAALACDTIIILGAYSICWGWMPFSLEIDQTFIGAILTAIGYSINDKVVIFDRVREFFGLYPKRDKFQLFNDSLNTTLARTINTSLSTLIVLLCIFILGGDSIRSFAFAMILGVVFGTLSSLFVASPIAYLLMKNKKSSELGEASK